MDIYSEIILDHYKHPHHYGTLPNATHKATVFNPLCGDTISLDARINEHDRIEEIKFESKGCAISTASMSMFSDMIQGKSKDEIMTYTKEDIQAMLGVELSPSRIKCALLGHEAVIRSFESEI